MTEENRDTDGQPDFAHEHRRHARIGEPSPQKRVAHQKEGEEPKKVPGQGGRPCVRQGNRTHGDLCALHCPDAAIWR